MRGLTGPAGIASRHSAAHERLRQM